MEFGKKKKPPEEGTKQTRKRKWDQTEEVPAAVPFKKKSIFFKYLSYWKTLNTPHAIDCMHLEKNVFESTIGVLLDIKGKTKDGIKGKTLKSTWKRSAPLMTGSARRHGSRTITRTIS